MNVSNTNFNGFVTERAISVISFTSPAPRVPMEKKKYKITKIKITVR